jgi:hypothetical protein
MSDQQALLSVLIAEREILRTLHRYGQALDYGVPDQFLDVFTDDAVVEVRMPDGSVGNLMEGREALTAYIAKAPVPPAAYNKHLTIDPLIEIDGDRATVVSYWLLLKGDAEGHPAIGSFGRYRDVLVQADGAWRIKERRTELEVM